MVSFISFVLPIYHKAARGFLFLSSPFSNQGHTNKQLSSLVDIHACNPLVWVALQNPTHIILWISPALYQGNSWFVLMSLPTSSSYLMSLPKSRPRLIKNSLTRPGKNSEWEVILFRSKVELTSLPSTGPIFFQKNLLLPFS